MDIGFELVADDGRLVLTQNGVAGAALAFYRRDHVLFLDETGRPLGYRADFLRGPDGRVAWLRSGGVLYRHVAADDVPSLRRRPEPPAAADVPDLTDRSPAGYETLIRSSWSSSTNASSATAR